MGIPNSFAHVFTDIEKLLAAVDANAAQVPGLAEAKAGLEQSFAVLKDLSVRRDTLNADKQALSQELLVAMKEGRERRSELRSFLKFKLGIRNEKLVEFRVPPQRPGKGKPRKTARAAKDVVPGLAAPAALVPATAGPAASGASDTPAGNG